MPKAPSPLTLDLLLPVDPLQHLPVACPDVDVGLDEGEDVVAGLAAADQGELGGNTFRRFFKSVVGRFIKKIQFKDLKIIQFKDSL